MVTNLNMTYWVYKDRTGSYRWQLVHKNGDIIADSGQGYTHEDDCIHGINLCAGSTGCAIKYR